VSKNAITNIAGEDAGAIPAHALPRLLYLGDVPIESSYHGSALLFRLLQSYPVEKLRIVETGISVSEKERRLQNVSYSDFTLGRARWLNTRFHRWVSSYFTLSASGRAAGISKLLDGCQPDAILTVAHGYGWLTAARYAQEHKLPFPVLKDDASQVADAFGAQRTPEVFLLDESRTVGYRGRIDDQFGIGFKRTQPTRRDLVEATQEVLAGKPVTTSVTDAPGCLIARARKPVEQATVTYTKNVAAILQKNCQ
jgi:hypothetical protein